MLSIRAADWRLHLFFCFFIPQADSSAPSSSLHTPNSPVAPSAPSTLPPSQLHITGTSSAPAVNIHPPEVSGFLLTGFVQELKFHKIILISHWIEKGTFPSKQNICITFIQRPPSILDVGLKLYKCYTNVLQWVLESPLILTKYPLQKKSQCYILLPMCYFTVS